MKKSRKAIGCDWISDAVWSQFRASARRRLREAGIRDEETAEDLMQDLAVLLLTPGGLRYDASKGPLNRYLFGVLRRSVLAHVRRTRRDIRVIVQLTLSDRTGSTEDSCLRRYE
jgi:DNA-directed RNA polymerase specialized sigma24 family protein